MFNDLLTQAQETLRQQQENEEAAADLLKAMVAAGIDGLLGDLKQLLGPMAEEMAWRVVEYNQRNSVIHGITIAAFPNQWIDRNGDPTAHMYFRWNRSWNDTDDNRVRRWLLSTEQGSSGLKAIIDDLEDFAKPEAAAILAHLQKEHEVRTAYVDGKHQEEIARHVDYLKLALPDNRGHTSANEAYSALIRLAPERIDEWNTLMDQWREKRTEWQIARDEYTRAYIAFLEEETDTIAANAKRIDEIQTVFDREFDRWHAVAIIYPDGDNRGYELRVQLAEPYNEETGIAHVFEGGSIVQRKYPTMFSYDVKPVTETLSDALLHGSAPWCYTFIFEECHGRFLYVLAQDRTAAEAAIQIAREQGELRPLPKEPAIPAELDGQSAGEIRTHVIEKSRSFNRHRSPATTPPGCR